MAVRMDFGSRNPDTGEEVEMYRPARKTAALKGTNHKGGGDPPTVGDGLPMPGHIPKLLPSGNHREDDRRPAVATSVNQPDEKGRTGPGVSTPQTNP